MSRGTRTTYKDEIAPDNNDQLVRRANRTIPWGYRVHEKNHHWLVPIAEDLQALEQAIEYLKTCSYREVSAWLTKKTGKYISQMGLLYIVKRRNGKANYKWDRRGKPTKAPQTSRETRVMGEARREQAGPRPQQDNSRTEAISQETHKPTGEDKAVEAA